MGSPSQKSPFRSRAASSGLTIVEVMVAAMVLAVAIGSSIMVLGTGFSLVELARDSTTASQMLQSKMENLRLKKWSEIDLSGDPNNTEPQWEDFELDASDFDELSPRFTTARLVTLVPGRGGLIKRVELRARWKTNNGVEHNRHYVTYFTKEGLTDYYYRTAEREAFE